MTALQAVILGVVQGLTELLPVSSSAHLVIAQSFMTEFHQPGVLFDAVLHVGTLFSVIYFFRNDIVSLAISILPGLSRRTVPEEQQKAFRKVAGLILISTAITVLIGFIFKDRIEILFSSVTVAASMLFVTGFFLFLSDWKKHIEKNEENLSVPGAALIGLIQAAALVPGISRSGSTIVCGIFLGLRREAAARYSFLLSVPAILGAVTLQAPHFSAVATGEWFPYALGFATSAITGFFSLHLLYFVIRRARLRFFAYYCWLAGGAVLLSL
ncbi:MAG TPA: undecaprenyl-diphosphate phosphatase [Syntrophales bacterium]|nr:undecaprenyl-diphosphate phosphatase [Syntrophales bacterium]HPX55827.1 undecaprenyl-diphosphate phosphatase [Syntrophales bacterium]HQA83133.1 undecaprenyl-diphosphate phosphatase [Syntrophales bacterium]